MRVSYQSILAIAIILTSVAVGLLASFASNGATLYMPAIKPNSQLKKGAVAVMFWSETCSACEMMLPHWRSIEKSPPAGVKVLDVPLLPGKTDRLFTEYRVTETPTFLLLKDGIVVDKIVGAVREKDPASYFRRWIKFRIMQSSPTKKVGELEPISFFSLPFLGALVAFSPCSAPIIATYATVGRIKRKKDYASCLGSSFAGTVILGSLLVIAASFVANLIKGLTLALAIAAILFGSLAIFTASRSCPLPGQRTRGLLSSGLLAACFSFGLISFQCSLPLLAGYVSIISAIGSPMAGITGISLLSLGMAFALIISLYLAKRTAGAFLKVTNNPTWLERINGILLIFLAR